ncbi:MAG: hypothetical protein A2038_03660 [Deltaproteobacteria bacterium GWA2_57_13]|nr:MAG: hypothetical protein A2038_03660 [Deltaproteobacteria bacterium GWA2_57_13]OGQ51555.1 MAG: hypothetical protein A3I10_02985 [Deltaproteobacteria bacterium RIFCSPLOWO2_02_FULL_57_26]OGQ81157.1 MAG: hypothetical protein A3G40_11085 [Deltaproteobacteria bacterium RIFCSPLOWO2_12_FULL_57_22]
MEDRFDPRFLKGIEQFNRGEFFECHETLEEIWLEEHGEDRQLYQGIIQIAAGYFKWEQGVLIGAIKLWRAGLAKIEVYPPDHLGIGLAAFVEGVRKNLAEIEATYQARGDSPPLEVPVLRLTHGAVSG